MKKALPLLLALVLCLALCACGSDDVSENTGSKEKNIIPLESVMDLDEIESVFVVGTGSDEEEEEWKKNTTGWSIYALEFNKMANLAKFNKNFIGNTYELTGCVFSIGADSCILGYDLNGSSSAGWAIGSKGGVKAILPTDDLAELTIGDIVKVVGTFAEATDYTVIMEDASLVK